MTVDISPQAPLPMVQLLQVFNLATHYFVRRPAENDSWTPELTGLSTEIPPAETTRDWNFSDNLTTSIFENEERNENGRSVLQAVREGNLTQVRQFLEKGANLWVSDEMGFSALHWAVLGDHVDIILVLLNNSANPNVRSAMDNTPLHRAVRIGNLPACRYLLQYKADVNAVNANGDMPLHEAARWGRTNIAQLLLHYGADLTAPNNWGRTPAQEAASNKRKEVRKFLEEEEARRNTLSYRNTLPKWYLVTRTNTSQAVQYVPTVPEVPTTRTTPIPITTTVSTTPISTVASTVSTIQERITTTQQNITSIATTTSFLLNTTYAKSTRSSSHIKHPLRI